MTKVNRIYPHKKTSGEITHEVQVKHAKTNGFKHPGSINGKMLHCIDKDDLYPFRSRYN